MSDLPCIEVDGEQYFLGNTPNPAGPTSRLRDYPDSDILTKDEIAKIITHPRRVRSRNRGWEFILNQGRRGSCNAYAAVGATMKKRYWSGMGQEVLSGEFIYAHINGGRDQGSHLNDGMEHMLEKGTCPFSMVPYEAYLLSEIPSLVEARRVALNYRGFEWYALPRDNHARLELAMATAIARDEPIVVAVHVDSRNFMKLDGDQIVLPTDGPGNHAVHADDVTISPTGEFLFDHCGSWGKRVHNQGRGYLTMKRHFRGPSEYHAFYALRSMRTDPNAETPINDRLG